MFSTHQQEIFEEVSTLLQEVSRKVNGARPLPVASGVDELTSGLSVVLAGLKIILQN